MGGMKGASIIDWFAGLEDPRIERSKLSSPHARDPFVSLTFLYLCRDTY